jgi:Ni/Co efflux regulator RcnB
MKTYLLVTAALSLLVPEIALAQDTNQRPDQRPGATRPDQRPQGTNRPTPTRPGPPAVRPPQTRPPQTRPPQGNVGPGHRPQVQPPRPGHSVKPTRPNRPGQHRPGAGRPHNFRPVHARPFHYPRGYAYRRWSIGMLLPSLLLSSNYYYNNYAPLGIGAPPPGYRWVRYGPDLLLVDIRTRRVADVIPGAFY